MRNSPLFAHATNFWANRFGVCFFLRTKLFDKPVLLVRSKCFYKPNFLFWKWWILCFVWNIPSQGLGGRVLPLFWRKNFVFPSLIRSRELFFPTLSIFPSYNGLLKKATPFGPGGRKVLTYSPVKKKCCCVFRFSTACPPCEYFILWARPRRFMFLEVCDTFTKFTALLCGV